MDDDFEQFDVTDAPVVHGLVDNDRDMTHALGVDEPAANASRSNSGLMIGLMVTVVAWVGSSLFFYSVWQRQSTEQSLLQAKVSELSSALAETGSELSKVTTERDLLVAERRALSSELESTSGEQHLLKRKSEKLEATLQRERDKAASKRQKPKRARRKRR